MKASLILSMTACMALIFCVFSCTALKPAPAPAQASGSAAAQSDTRDAPGFVLGSADEISITVWQHDDLQRTVQIDSDGNLFFPLAGQFQAAGLTLSQLRKTLTQKLDDYIVDPQVDVYLSKLVSRKVHVLGEVETPGSLTLSQNMSVLEALLQAGWFTRYANENGVLLIRKAEDEAEVCVVKVAQLIKDRRIHQAPQLRNNDVLYVPPDAIGNLEKFMETLNNLISPVVTLERAIILEPEVADVLKGRSGDASLTISP